MTERFFNSFTQPAAPDTTLSADYTPGDGVLNVAGLPTGVSGGDFRVKVGGTLYKVTGLGAGNVVWAVPDGAVEGTSDAGHATGTDVYLVDTAGARETMRAIDYITATDQTANGYPNSVPLGTVSVGDLADGADVILEGDSRLTDGRTPTAHSASHENGGGDEIEIANLGTAETNDTLVLAPDGAGGVEWRAETGGAGALVLLEQHTAAASAQLDFTSWYSSTYDEYLVEFINIFPATDGADLLLRVSTNGGSSYDSGSNYFYAWSYVSNAAATGVVNGNPGTAFTLFTAISTSFEGYNGSVKLFNPGNTSYRKSMSVDSVASQTTAVYRSTGFCIWNNTAAFNAFRVLFGSGNIASGVVRVYGIAK